MRSHLPFFILIASLIGTALDLSADPVTIMPLGDSITAGVGSSDGSGYRYPLYTDLNAANFSFQFVGSATTQPNALLPTAFFTAGDAANNGYGHYQIGDIQANLTMNTPVASADYNQGGDWLTVNPNPNIILLMIGTNDFLQQNYANIDTNLFKLVTAISSASPKSQILIGGTIPIKGLGTNPYGDAGQTTGYYPLVLAYDSYIQNTLVKEIPNTTYVDQVDNFLNPDGTLNFSLYSTADGIHPDDAGYAKIAATWDAAILQAEDAPEPSTLPLIAAGALALLAIAGFRKKFSR